MTPTEPLALHHSWPIFERGLRLNLGCVHDCDTLLGAAAATDPKEMARLGIGVWDCDLSGNSLTWSAEVFDLFGLPQDARLSRAASVALYCEHSRSAMERLRAYAIRHRRGFTLDTEIRPAGANRRWIRLVAAPIREAGRVVRLAGLKQDVTREYARSLSRT